MIDIQVSMSYEEYKRANRVWLLHTTLSRRLNLWFVLYVAPILGIFLILLAVFLWFAPGATKGPTLLFNAAWGLLCLWCPIQYPRKIRKLYQEQASKLSGRMILQSTGLDYQRSDGSANAHYAWAAFDLWTDQPDAFLLMPGSTSFVRIPKDHLSLQDQNEVRGWLTPIKQAK